MRRITRAEYLEGVHRSLSADANDLTLEFRPFSGWYLCGEPRYFGDDGSEWIGANWREAEKVLRWLYPQRKAA